MNAYGFSALMVGLLLIWVELSSIARHLQKIAILLETWPGRYKP